MYLRYSTRVTIASFLLVIAAFLASLKTLSSLAFYPARFTHDSVTEYEKRFAEVKKLLPVDKAVGYITDTDASIEPNGGEARRHFYLAQYAIIPTILSDSTTPELVLGNFENAKIDTRYLVKRNLVIEKNFGDGVLLLHHKKQ